METEKTQGTPAATADQNLMTCAPAPRSAAGETIGRAKGEAIGGAIGHAMGVGVDVVLGGVAGAIAAGKNGAERPVNESRDPAAEHEFWRKEYWNRPYFTHGTSYAEYAPAFQYGWESYSMHKGETFNDIEPRLALAWENHRGSSKLSWSDAKVATHDAWARAAQADCPDAFDCI